MALKFTSQQQQKKFKLKEEEPYVVSEITKRGACGIHTLKGANILGFINEHK